MNNVNFLVSYHHIKVKLLFFLLPRHSLHIVEHSILCLRHVHWFFLQSPLHPHCRFLTKGFMLQFFEFYFFWIFDLLWWGAIYVQIIDGIRQAQMGAIVVS